MQAEIISIGDELLIGQTINTNASWIGAELSLIGIPVKWGIAVADDQQAIMQAVDQAINRSELVIVTGGLGPTKDDITKHTLCQYFDTTLEINPDVLKRIEAIFKNKNRPMLDVNLQQAALPKSCEIIQNFNGTASGMWFEKNGSILVSLPGVPYEMKGMMKDFLLKKFQQIFQVSSLFHRTILTTGLGESFLADQMSDWENRIREAGLGLAYLPSPGTVKLRISSSKGEIDAPQIDAFFNELRERMPLYVFGEENETLSGVVGKLLKAQNKTLGTVESCTSGGLAKYITEIPGASDYFQGSLVTYSNHLKELLAYVQLDTIKSFGAVSEQTVAEMALGGLKKLGVDYCISTSGTAGPDGGTEEIPVGTIWISVASKEKVISKKLNLGDNRERNVQMTIFASLNLLRCVLLNIYTEKK
jgi:nicotinamide-nucleotide amidase